MSQEPSFSLDEAIRAQKALRSELGLGEETFPMDAFVGMISDEIEQHRKAGRSDEDIARIIREATGKPMSADTIGRFYASPDQRHPHA